MTTVLPAAVTVATPWSAIPVGITWTDATVHELTIVPGTARANAGIAGTMTNSPATPTSASARDRRILSSDRKNICIQPQSSRDAERRVNDLVGVVADRKADVDEPTGFRCDQPVDLPKRWIISPRRTLLRGLREVVEGECGLASTHGALRVR
jgi:hypothetical protein